MSRPNPFNPPDDTARALVRELMAKGHAALAVIDETGTPAISRVAFGRDAAGVPLILISGLAAHTGALRANADCAFMLGDPGPKGDPMTSPRLMVKARAEFAAGPDEHSVLRAAWLAANPKATVYIDLPDFSFCRLHPVSAVLNAGFGRAFRLTPADLG
ncbi:MAG: pyridoxamine 5'-phosphate oxidase family protein [Paracoccaceae bacterium]